MADEYILAEYEKEEDIPDQYRSIMKGETDANGKTVWVPRITPAGGRSLGNNEQLQKDLKQSKSDLDAARTTIASYNGITPEQANGLSDKNKELEKSVASAPGEYRKQNETLKQSEQRAWDSAMEIVKKAELSAAISKVRARQRPLHSELMPNLMAEKDDNGNINVYVKENGTNVKKAKAWDNEGNPTVFYTVDDLVKDGREDEDLAYCYPEESQNGGGTPVINNKQSPRDSSDYAKDLAKIPGIGNRV